MKTENYQNLKKLRHSVQHAKYTREKCPVRVEDYPVLKNNIGIVPK